jgi:hypothetical protein
MEKILNLSRYRASLDLTNAGVVDLSEANRGELIEMYTFGRIPSKATLSWNCRILAEMALAAASFSTVMIDPEPWMAKYLIEALDYRGLKVVIPYYTIEGSIGLDGSFDKVKKFQGFVEAI